MKQKIFYPTTISGPSPKFQFPQDLTGLSYGHMKIESSLPLWLQHIEHIRRDNPDARRGRLIAAGVLAAATSLNDTRALHHLFSLEDLSLSLMEQEEVLLQTMLFAGFPRTIEALQVLRQFHPFEGDMQARIDEHTLGMATSKSIYGVHHARLLEFMDKLHPDLTRWMIEDGYGRVLSRPGLGILERECAVLAALMATGMVNQFKAHLRGCLNLGLDQDDTVWFTNTFNCILPADLDEAFQTAKGEVIQKWMQSSM